jgi:hypothetical protein
LQSAERKAKESQPRDEAEIEAERKAVQKELEGFEVL